MSTEASAVQNTSVKDDIPTTTTNTEPVLSTQVEPSSDLPKSTEEEEAKQVKDQSANTANNDASTSPTTEETSKPANTKLRSMFSTFSKGSKKEVPTITTIEETPATTEHAAEVKTGTSPPHSENKLSKGLGNLFSRVKTATNKENEHEPHTNKTEHTDTVADDKENSSASPAAAVATTTESTEPANVTQDETPSSGDHAAEHHPHKRQSLLSKFFGKKKEDEHAEKEHENEDHEPNIEREVENVAVQEPTQPSSPPLGRRLTGFFTKKISKLDKGKQQKSSEKLETSDGEAEPEAEGGNVPTHAADKELPQHPEEELNAPVTTTHTTAEDTSEGLQSNNLTSNAPVITAK